MKTKVDKTHPRIHTKIQCQPTGKAKTKKPKQGGSKSVFYSVRESKGPDYDMQWTLPMPAARITVSVPIRCVPFGDAVLCPEDALRTLRHDSGCDSSVLGVEGVFAVYLNVKSAPLDLCCVAVGAADGCTVPLSSIFYGAIRCGATSFILVHNHPSGHAGASDIDVNLTCNILAACRIMGIELVDHIIVGSGEQYFSFRESHKELRW